MSDKPAAAEKPPVKKPVDNSKFEEKGDKKRRDIAPEKAVKFREALALLNNLYAGDIEEVKAGHGLMLEQFIKLTSSFHLMNEVVDAMLGLLIEKKVLGEDDQKRFEAEIKKRVSAQSDKIKEHLIEVLSKTPQASYMHGIAKYIKSKVDKVDPKDNDQGDALKEKAKAEKVELPKLPDQEPAEKKEGK